MSLFCVSRLTLHHGLMKYKTTARKNHIHVCRNWTFNILQDNDCPDSNLTKKELILKYVGTNVICDATECLVEVSNIRVLNLKGESSKR